MVERKSNARERALPERERALLETALLERAVLGKEGTAREKDEW